MKSQILQLATHILVLSAISASAATRYVDVNSASPTPPYTNWTTAATTIQAAVDAAVADDQILVTNGVYQTGGRGRAVFGALRNRVAVDKPVTVQSVNGAGVTVIRGFQVPGTTNGDSAIRCVYLTNGAALVGFTLADGATGSSGDDPRQRTGGGVWCESASAVVSNCTLSGNSADWGGGGANGGTLNNCTLTGNSAYYGGGANSCTLNNCTLTGNSATEGGGAYGSTLNNCIVYYNSARNGGNNYSDSVLTYSCTTPLPPEGVGNISTEPQLADLFHLSAGSPCRGAGSAAYSTGLDIDGESWANPPSIGCDEYHPGAVTGPLSVSIQAAYTNMAVGFAANFTAAIDRYATANRWDFGDGTVVSNRPYASHSWAMAGDYSVVFQAYNDTYPGGISATVAVHVVAQSVHYVTLGNANPVAPYTSWATAANTIQDAVDVASEGGAVVLVTNGVYQTGGRVVFGAMTNRVAVDKPMTVQSVNGAAVTVIRGFQVPETINGDSAIRCVYLINGAALVGFTLANGATGSRNSGDYQRETGGGVWCESASVVVSNCTLTANAAGSQGGGAFGGTLNNCILKGNSAYHGGGAAGSTLNNCTLTGNSATYGGGVGIGRLNDCALTGNSATESGGGASDGTLNNCTLSGNSAGLDGGGAYHGTMNNCTLSGNLAGREGGGANGGTLNNCIVYYNTALRSGDNYSSDTYNLTEISFSHSCTTPLPSGGEGNISAEPQLASVSHLSAGSPCRGSGSPAYSTGLDIDGETWANPPSMGCDEYQPGAVTGPLRVAIQAAYTNVIMGFAVNLTAAIDGRTTASRWVFDDGTVVSNQPYTSHSWALAGDYSVVLQAYNETYPGGISSTVTVQVVAQPVHYVALSSPHPAAPYTSWATAANNIQDAVDAALVAGALVLVTNGVYQTGGRAAPELARVAVTKPLVLRSVNGAAVTVIQGYRDPDPFDDDYRAPWRCVYLANGAALVGFTLTNGLAYRGGGVWCESASAVVSNCVLTGNSVGMDGYGGGAFGGTLNNCTLRDNTVSRVGYGGGGAHFSTLNNCTLSGNSATYGGGASSCTLNNCTLTGNSAINSGGGASGCTLNNCIVYYNSAPNEDNYLYSVLSYSCTTPLPTEGIGNLSDAPLFVDYAGGNLRLQSNSPCLNAGSNASAPVGPELDGNPRIAGSTVDVGAYEFQAPQSLISYAWLQQYGLPTDGSADVTDADGDGLNNWQEWHAGTNPTDALSVLRLLSPVSGAPGVMVSWQSVSGLNYFLERGTDLGAQPPFVPLATNIVGQPGTTAFMDTNAVGAGPFFYRVGAQE